MTSTLDFEACIVKVIMPQGCVSDVKSCAFFGDGPDADNMEPIEDTLMLMIAVFHVLSLMSSANQELARAKGPL